MSTIQTTNPAHRWTRQADDGRWRRASQSRSHLAYRAGHPNKQQRPVPRWQGCYAGWDVHKGDTSTVIGITDTGTDMDHPDLASNMKRNWADPIDGVDNDNDGYTDNFT